MICTDLFRLVGSIFIDNDKANDSLQKTDDKAKKVGTSFKDVAGGAAKVGTAIVGASAAAVSGIVAIANSTAEAADTVDKGSIRMGISAERYQELAYAAGQSGVSMETMESAAKKLEGTDMSFDEAIASIMELETAEERSAKAAELFGEKVAYNLAPLIEQSSEDFDGLIQRANDLGLVMSGDDVKAAVKLGDTMSDVTQSFQSIGKQLGTAVIPLVQKFADKIIEYMPMIMSMFDRIAPVIGMLFDKLMPPLMDIVEEIFPILMEFIEELLPPIIEIVASILPMFVELLHAFMPILRPILDLLLAILPPLIDIINVVLKPIMSLLSKLIELLSGALGAAITWIAEKITAGWNNLKNALGNIVEFVKVVWEGIKTAFKAGVNGVIWFINKMIDGINLLLTPLRAVIMAVGNLFGANWTMDNVKIPQIPALANGGITKSPGWSMTGEEGPELQYMPKGASVVPLNRGSGAENDLFSQLSDIKAMLRTLIEMKPNYGVYLDGNAVVGYLAPDMDQALGKIAVRNGRNV